MRPVSEREKRFIKSLSRGAKERESRNGFSNKREYDNRYLGYFAAGISA